MSYAESGGMLDFFHPYIPLATTDAGIFREIDIGAASTDHGEYICHRACTVKKVMFVPLGELAGGTTTAPTVVFTKRPTPLSATGATAVGTVTVPDATAVGKVVYKEVDVNFSVGDSIHIAHTVGVGTPTGIGLPLLEAFHKPEDARSEGDMILSA